MLWFFAALIIIFFIPINIKLTLLYQNRKVYIYLFKRQFKIKEKVSEKKANVENAKDAEWKLKKFLPKDMKTTLFQLRRSKYKPKLKLRVELDYGFEDAALTGFACGIFHTFSPLMYEFAGMIFNVRRYEYIVNPQFNNPMLNFRISSIISINLAKIIYMLFLIYLR